MNLDDVITELDIVRDLPKKYDKFYEFTYVKATDKIESTYSCFHCLICKSTVRRNNLQYHIEKYHKEHLK